MRVRPHREPLPPGHPTPPMKYEMRRPTTEAEAIEIIDGALRVISGQIDVYRGVKKKAWNGDYVDHLRVEANHAVAWLADRFPKSLTAGASTLSNGGRGC